MPFYHWQGEDLLLDCHLQPGAKRAEFAGQHGERLKIRISAPPVDGKANEALIRFLADAFAVSRQQVSLLSGQSSRQKRLLIQTPRQLPTELGIQRR
jgi:uncharacterized protein (TIGR00251 family)|tara:strand:- start:1515 stop:1805 length:291 start_codon:yes stop_codon:yes gene_type:complete